MDTFWRQFLAKGCHHFAHGRVVIRLQNRACVPKRKHELCACSDNIQVSRSFPRHSCTRRSRRSVRVKHGTKGSSFVSTESVMERDHGKNVLVFVLSASVRVVSSSSFNTEHQGADGSACVAVCRRGLVTEAMEAHEELTGQEVPRTLPS